MRPVETIPSVRIRCGGKALGPLDLTGLSKVHVRECLSAPSLCELTFLEPRDELLAGQLVQIGALLEVQLSDAHDDLFEGDVAALEQEFGAHGGTRLIVRAYDRLQRARHRRPVKRLSARTLRELAEEIFDPHGLRVCSDLPDLELEARIQWNESDLDFFDRIARSLGGYFVLRDDTVHLLSLAGRREAPIELEFGASLLAGRIEATHTPPCSVKAEGWNAHSVSWFSEKVDAELGEGDVRRPLAEQPLSQQRSDSEAEATALARAELERQERASLFIEAHAVGDTRLRPGTSVRILSTRPLLADRFALTSVEHTISAEAGYRVALSSEPPNLREPVSSIVASFGRVTRVDDPEGRGRVRVELPTCSHQETSWAPVVFPGGAPDKGLICVPDVGDSVLVLFPHGDPADAFVLGGVHGADPPWDSGVEGHAVRRFSWKTPGGHAVNLDDERRRVELSGRRILASTSRGTRVDLTNDLKLTTKGTADLESAGVLTLRADNDLVLEAPGHTISLRAGKINFETL